MIGGLADWFAVVALFRHPMGIPIPHTGILPRHRAKLTASIVDVLQNNWLNKQSILERIGAWSIVPKVVEYLADTARRKPVLQMLRHVALNTVRDTGDADIADKVSALVQHELTEERILRAMRRAGGYAVSSGLIGQMLPPVFERSRQWCETKEARDLVTALVREAANKYAKSPVKQFGVTILEAVNIIDYAKIADSVLAAVARELDAARSDANHTLRVSIERSLQEYIEGIEENAEIREAAARFRASLSANGTAPDWLRDMVRDGFDALRTDLEKEDPVVMQYLDRTLGIGLERLRANPDSVASADLWVKEKIGEAVESYHGEIGRLVSDNLAKLDDAEMVRQIEAKVGDDLQFIRVNGAVVGGLVGAAIFLFKYFVMG